MCWSLEITASFVVFDVFTLYLLLKLVKWYDKNKFICYVLFVTFYGIMELLQLLQWIEITCIHVRFINVILTCIAYILIWLQPVLFAAFETISSSRPSTVMRLAQANFLYAIIRMLQGLTAKGQNIVGTNYAENTNTVIGINGHLLWLFSTTDVSYQPTHYVYMLLILSCLCGMISKRLNIIVMGWIFTLIISVSIIGVGPELPSFWCFTSVFVNVPILLEGIVAKYFNKSRIEL